MTTPLLLAAWLAAAPTSAEGPVPPDLRDAAALVARNRELEALIEQLRLGLAVKRLDAALARVDEAKRLLAACLLSRPVDEQWVNPGPIELLAGEGAAFAELRRRLPWIPAVVNGKSVFPGPSEAQFHELLSEFSLLLKEAAELAVTPEPRIKVLVEWAYETRVRWPGGLFVVRLLEWKPRQEIMDRLAEAGAISPRP